MICSNCKLVNVSEALYCEQCGNSLIDKAKPIASYCPNCGEIVEENAIFCKSCGKSFFVKCPSCNYENTQGTIFCSQCGSKTSKRYIKLANIRLNPILLSSVFVALLIIIYFGWFSVNSVTKNKYTATSNKSTYFSEPRNTLKRTITDNDCKESTVVKFITSEIGFMNYSKLEVKNGHNTYNTIYNRDYLHYAQIFGIGGCCKGDYSFSWSFYIGVYGHKAKDPKDYHSYKGKFSLDGKYSNYNVNISEWLGEITISVKGY